MATELGRQMKRAVKALLEQTGDKREFLHLNMERHQTIVVFKDGQRQVPSRIAYEYFYGPIPPDKTVRHADGDRMNFSKDNLYLSPRYGNQTSTITHGMDDDLRSNLSAIERLRHAILSIEQRELNADEIEVLKQSDLSHVTVAKKLQISRARVIRLRSEFGVRSEGRSMQALIYTDLENELILDTTVPIREIARQIGKSRKAVTNQRRRLLAA